MQLSQHLFSLHEKRVLVISHGQKYTGKLYYDHVEGAILVEYDYGRDVWIKIEDIQLIDPQERIWKD